MSGQLALKTAATDADPRQIQAIVEKSRTSFYWAMRVLPRRKRDAMFAVYAYCREVDDIADGDLPVDAKLAALQQWRAEIDHLYKGRPRHPITVALRGPVHEFRLRRLDFEAILAGVGMDAEGPIVAPRQSVLELYCARVAGAVGRLSLRIFGAPEECQPALARSLGQAVQLTNVLRDLAEDAEIGRLYLPRELLEKHGVPTDSAAAALRHPGLPLVCDELARLALRDFDVAAELIARQGRRELKAAAVIMMIYRRLLERLMARGFARYAEPVRLGKMQKMWIALRYGLL
ncbi:MAG: presqualene diphosphate synthase HpnD [Rhodospirillaceae bacterium]|nr:presqualene diphosphate synthase HpnD [Rhodospirillaceae bacterium]